MLNLRVEDRDGRLEEEIRPVMEEGTAVLERVQAGEKRYEDYLGWLHINEWAGESSLDEIEKLAAGIREDADVFVLNGIGGSNNAARAAATALQKGRGAEIVYMGNTLSPDSLTQALEKLKGKSVYVDCIAKNSETLEPGSSFRVLRRMLYERYGAKAAKRIVCTGSRGSSLEKLSEENGYRFLDFPLNVGGRFSGLTAVGLLPMAAAGLDIRALVQGAADMEERLFHENAEENIALRYACLRNYYYRKGYKIEMLASFEPQFRGFFKWWTQIFAETEGKDGKGLFPASAEFCEELHAVGQYIQDGAPLLFETFLDVQEPNASLEVNPDSVKDGFSYLDGWDFWDINKAAFHATVKAHREKLPCLIFEVGCLDEYHFGQLFYFFEFACYLSAELLGVNPFDQPGVENYKKWMFQALGKA